VRRRLLGVIGAIVLAAIGTAILVMYVSGAEDRALAGERVVKVLVVKSTVPAGTPASSLGDMVEAKKVTTKVRAEGSVSTTQELAGLVTSAELVPGEQLVKARFVQPSVYNAQATGVQVPPGLLQTTISLSPDRAVGGVLTPGTTVAVVVSFDGEDVKNDPVDGVAVRAEGATPKVTHMILQKVLVTNVQGGTTPAAPSTTGPDKTAAAPAVPSGSLLVTLALDAPSVERVVFAAESGKLWLAIEPKDANEGGTRVQTRGTVLQ